MKAAPEMFIWPNGRPDHWIPREAHGTDSLNNLRSACRDCNRGKGSLYWGDHPGAAGILARQPRPVMKPPLEYQLKATRQLIDSFRARGARVISLDELSAALEKGPITRDGYDPFFEPLTLVTISDALGELTDGGELSVVADGRLGITDLNRR